MEVFPYDTIPSVGLGEGVATHEHREWCVSIVPQKEPYFPPPIWRSRHMEVEVGINSVP
jgi:hypothetical protein